MLPFGQKSESPRFPDSDVHFETLSSEEDKTPVENTQIAINSEPLPGTESSSPPWIPRAHHLVYCTIEEYEQLELPPHHIYDIVEGLLICKSFMPAHTEHDDISEDLPRAVEYHNPSIKSSKQPSTEVDDTPVRGKPSWITGLGIRHPDIAFYSVVRRSMRTKSNSGRNRKRNISPGSPKIKFRKHSPPLSVVEITSKSTRQEDLEKKWLQYADTKINVYLIIDRHDPCNPTVIVGSLDPFSDAFDHWILFRMRWIIGSFFGCVGSLDPFSDAFKSFDGYPDTFQRDSDEKKGSKLTGALVDTSRHTLYYKKVYRSDDVVDCKYFAPLGLTARQMSDSEYLRNLADNLRREQENAAKKLVKSNKKLSTTNRRLADTSKKLVSTTKQLDDVARERDVALEEIVRLKEEIQSTKRRRNTRSTKRTTQEQPRML